MSFEWVDSVCVVVHAPMAPSEQEWRAYCEALLERGTRTGAQLIWGPGTVPPSPLQRERVRKVWEEIGRAPPMAVITTNSIAVRGIITAMNWFLSQRLKAFALDDFEGAFAYLGIEANDAKRAIRASVRSQAERIGAAASSVT